jgi:predicted patatin/cPLA2 family phospholipase
MERVGLVLEGGGMRGVYTAGVLERFMEQDVYFPYVIGVSAGACNAVSYLSRQRGRNRRVMIDASAHPEYISFKNWIKRGSIFGMDLIFDRLPNELDPLDYDRLFSIEETLVVGTTNPDNGKPMYYYNQEWTGNRSLFSAILQASSSLPFFSKGTVINSALMYDGGVADPIPVRKALDDGCDRLVVILTKDESYRIKPFRHRWLADRIYRKYPPLIEAMQRREQVYNESVSLIERLKSEGRAYVIRPSSLLPVRRIERDHEKLESLYTLGLHDANAELPSLREWLGSTE